MDEAQPAWRRRVSFSASMSPITRARSLWDGAAAGSASSASRVRRSDSNSPLQAGQPPRWARTRAAVFSSSFASASSGMWSVQVWQFM